MSKKTKTILISCLLLIMAVPAYIAFAGDSILISGGSQVTAGDGYTFKINLDPIKSASKLGEGEDLAYSVTVNISPLPESISVSPDVNVQQLGSKLSFQSADLENVNSIDITVYPGKTITSNTEYSVTASVAGVDIPSESLSFTAVPAQQQKDDPQSDDPNSNDDKKSNTKGGSKAGGSMSGGSASVDSSLVYAGSWDNYLEELSVDGYEFTHKFHKTRTTYFVNVPDDVERLDVSAEASDSSASVRITGEDNIADDNSKILINVTADNGETRVYRIYVTHNTEEQ